MDKDIVILAVIILCFIGMMLFNAWMDTLQHHFGNSIFKNKNRFEWDPNESWDNKYEADGKTRKKFLGIVIPAIFSDPWHRFKAAFLFCLFIPISLLLEDYLFEWYWNFLIEVLAWAIVWEIIYNISSGKNILSAWTKKR